MTNLFLLKRALEMGIEQEELQEILEEKSWN